MNVTFKAKKLIERFFIIIIVILLLYGIFFHLKPMLDSMESLNISEISERNNFQEIIPPITGEVIFDYKISETLTSIQTRNLSGE